MANVFFDNIVEFHQYDFDLCDDIFEQILETRKEGFDSKRFFIRYIAPEELEKYDFSNRDSLNQFRDICCSFDNPLQKMGGCNVRADFLEKGFRKSGIILSDPQKRVVGQFDVRNHIVTYSPIFPFFYEERDLIKFANDIYFTTIPFEELVMNQIEHAEDFFIHTGYYQSSKNPVRNGEYILEKISKEEMIGYLTDEKKGQKILEKRLYR